MDDPCAAGISASARRGSEQARAWRRPALPKAACDVPQRTTTSVPQERHRSAVASDTRHRGPRRQSLPRANRRERAVAEQMSRARGECEKVLADFEQDDEYRPHAMFLSAPRYGPCDERCRIAAGHRRRLTRLRVSCQLLQPSLKRATAQERGNRCETVARAWTSDDECKVTVIEPVYGDGDGALRGRARGSTPAPADVDTSPIAAKQPPHFDIRAAKGANVG